MIPANSATGREPARGRFLVRLKSWESGWWPRFQPLGIGRTNCRRPTCARQRQEKQCTNTEQNYICVYIYMYTHTRKISIKNRGKTSQYSHLAVILSNPRNPHTKVKTGECGKVPLWGQKMRFGGSISEPCQCVLGHSSITSLNTKSWLQKRIK